MNSQLLKRLFRAIQSGSGPDMAVLCRKVVEEERKAGHGRVAEDLERILEAPVRRAIQPAAPRELSALPTSKRDSAPLLQEVPRDLLRHAMVLPPSVEARLHRIEKEFAARTRLALHGLQPRRRILLHGPPGCGKSLAAERLAWNTGLSLLKVRFDTLLSSYFGKTHTNLRKVFDAAEATPCALFLDECDTLALEMDGMSYSEVTQIARNAAKHAVLEGRKKVTEDDMRFALGEIHERHHESTIFSYV